MVELARNSSTSLPVEWEDLLNLLRDELQEYGGLIGLLSAQQQSILNRQPDSLLEINQSVQTQMEASQMLQHRRQGYVSSIAEFFGEDRSSTLSELVSHFPMVTQPMFLSIIEEINNLISQVKRQVIQNQKLLARLTEVTDQILSATDPSSHTKTYNKQGDLRKLVSQRSSLNESA